MHDVDDDDDGYRPIISPPPPPRVALRLVSVVTDLFMKVEGAQMTP